MARLLLTALLLSMAGAAAADAPARSTAPETVAETFVQAWNAHAPGLFGALLASDADWVTASAVVLKGRADIERYLAREHAGWARETTMTAEKTSARAVSADVFIVKLEWRITDPTRTEAERSFTGANQFVAIRSAEGWRVVAGQVTSGRGRAAR
jgi:uncharacterized protein (TIGR02246 family)